MSNSLPELLDPRKACANGEDYRGDVPLGAFPRLISLAEAGQLDPNQTAGGGQAAYRLRFRRDDSGRDIIDGSVRALLRLRCQRCAEGFDLTVDAEVSLAVVDGLDEAEALPDAYDPLLLEQALIRPRDLVEDELILAVPAVPRHQDGACRPPAQAAGSDDESTERPNPFAALAALKRAPGQADDD